MDESEKEGGLMPLMSCQRKVLEFTVLGNPKGQGRPRFTTKGKFVKAYDPKESADEKSFIRLAAQQAIERQNWLMPSPDMPIELELKLYCQIPASRQRWFKEAALMDIIVPLAKPDADNVVKMYMDALSHIAYPDDKQVFRISVDTHYGEKPRIEVKVTGYFLNIGDIKSIALTNVRAKQAKSKARL